MKRGVIFTDIDGTLAFHAKIHGVRKVADNPDGSAMVAAPDAGMPVRAWDVSTELYEIYLGARTRELAQELRRHYTIVFVSAARAVSLKTRAKLDFADAYILESGSMLYDGEWRQDAAWEARIAPQRVVLFAFARELERQGLRLDLKGRTSALRVRPEDNPQFTAGGFAQWYADLKVPATLQATRNIGYVDVFPAAAGKRNAVEYLRARLGYVRALSVGIGDDENDIDYLRACGRALVPASAYPAVLAAARAGNMTVAAGGHFAGIDEILTALLHD